MYVYGDLHDGLPTSTFLRNPVQQIMSGQEPRGQTALRVGSSGLRVAIGEVALSLGPQPLPWK